MSKNTVRNDDVMPAPKLQALKDLTLSLVRQRGNVSDEELQAFYDAGYGHKQVLEIILGLSQKVISNYVNRVAKTPVDPMFQKFTWTK